MVRCALEKRNMVDPISIVSSLPVVLPFVLAGLITLVEFQGSPSMKWKACMFEQSVVQQLLDSQFHTFVERVKTTDCQAELKRLLAAGPPVHVSDKVGFPLEEGDTHVENLWFASDGQERSAILDGAVEGEERQQLWDELKEFIIVDGKEKGDDENGENGNTTSTSTADTS
jgi:hypothetical protein